MKHSFTTLPPWASNLPIEEVLPQLLEGLENSFATVLVAPPGAGKTIRVPFSILQSNLLGDGQLLLLEPRKMAARASARTMARMLGEQVGETVGYRVRFDERSSDKTKILAVTEEVLTRRFLRDPFLDGSDGSAPISCVVLDEFHERSVQTDLNLAFIRELLQVRDDLKVVVMSATIDPEPVSAFLGGCPVVSSEGRLFPLSIQHIPRADERPLHIRCAGAISKILKDGHDDGDVLVFLPGAPEIKRLKSYLDERGLHGDPEIVPLYGALSAQEQDMALTPGQKRQVVLATNIAETSLTIPNVTAVVDTGLVKIMRSDAGSGLERLETTRISKHSATQRAGRAGRTAQGRVIRLWTQVEHRTLPNDLAPEIKRIDLATPLLAVMTFHPGDPSNFEFFDPPSDHAMRTALNLLKMLQAVDDQFALTKKGMELVSLPLHPRLGSILLRGGLLGANIAAMMAERDILKNPRQWDIAGDCDLSLRLELLECFVADGATPEAARRNEINYGAAKELIRAQKQLSRFIKKQEGKEQTTGQILLSGFPDRVCKRREPGGKKALMTGGRAVSLSEESCVRDSELFIAMEVRNDKVRKASAINRANLEQELGHLLKKVETAVFDNSKQVVQGLKRLMYTDLIIEEKRSDSIDDSVLAKVLADEASKRFDQIFKPERQTRELLDRLRFAAKIIKSPAQPWPDFSNDGLGKRLEMLCLGKRSFEQLQKIDWQKELLSTLDWKLRELLDKNIPASLQVASGSQIKIDYSSALTPEGKPILAARIQEMFGMAKTPCIAGGKVELLIHLLAPNGRPAQITTDLKGFWNGSYQQVKKELKGRYPKHHWPDDPWNAAPTARAKQKIR